mgnify:CR=1 FL=1|tara:strand:- start:7485 stop:8546 length:1062 start_codon:yes stop_codon:yes gene_type:complete
MEAFTRLRLFWMLVALSLITACGSDTGFNLGGEQAAFEQSVTSTPVKVDILWVVDNSGSMATSQDNVANNFASFIQKFQQTNFDYQMAVTTTEAWRGSTDPDPVKAYNFMRFRDGTDATSYSGVKVIKPDTPDLENVFQTNILQGITGSGSERGFESLQTAMQLQDNLDEPFPRPGALLAVIVLSDEDDVSAQAPDPGNDPDWFVDKDYYNFLYNLSGSTPTNLNFLFNTVGILDQNCLDELTTPTFGGRKIAQRYLDMSDRTGGYKGSLCDDFTDVMAGVTDLIIQKSTAFKLSREPALDTVVVKIDGVVIPMDPDNGWTYDSATMLISFHGTAIPGTESIVSITYDPAGLK